MFSGKFYVKRLKNHLMLYTIDIDKLFTKDVIDSFSKSEDYDILNKACVFTDVDSIIDPNQVNCYYEIDAKNNTMFFNQLSIWFSNKKKFFATNLGKICENFIKAAKRKINNFTIEFDEIDDTRVRYGVIQLDRLPAFAVVVNYDKSTYDILFSVHKFKLCINYNMFENIVSNLPQRFVPIDLFINDKQHIYMFIDTDNPPEILYFNNEPFEFYDTRNLNIPINHYDYIYSLFNKNQILKFDIYAFNEKYLIRKDMLAYITFHTIRPSFYGCTFRTMAYIKRNKIIEQKTFENLINSIEIVV